MPRLDSIPRPAAVNGGRLRPATASEQGVTLFELLVAILLLGITATMIYSVLNVGIRFTEQGNARILAMNEKYNLLELMRRQVSCAFYDPKQKKMLISGDGDTLRLVTRAPFLHREAGVVYAFYRYVGSDRTLYYTEKRDFYNIDYDENYLPDLDKMTPLLITANPVDFAVETAEDVKDAPTVTVRYGEATYRFQPRRPGEQALQ